MHPNLTICTTPVVATDAGRTACRVSQLCESTGGEHLFGSCAIPWRGGAYPLRDDRHEHLARFPYVPDSGVRTMRAWAMPAEEVSPEHE